MPENEKIIVMGLIAGLIALPLGLIVSVIITIIYYLKKNRKEKELSTSKIVLSTLGVFFISTLITIPAVFYLLFLMYSAAT